MCVLVSKMADRKKKKKETKYQKILYIAFSIIASIALWMYVAYVENPDASVTITGISIEYTSSELLADNGLVVTNVDAETLNIRFVGKRNTVTKLSDKNMTATVDLSEIIKDDTRMAGVYQLSYDLAYDGASLPNGVSIASASKSYISVTVEKLDSVIIPVRGVYNGGVGEGYSAETPVVSPETITVSGPQAVVTKIAYAQATLERANLTKSVTEAVPLVLYDDDDNVIESDDLILSQDTVNITLSVLMIKEVPLYVNAVYGASAGESNTKITIDPVSVTLSGDPEILSEINQIVIGTIDFTRFASTTTETFPITPPNDVKNVTGELTAEVTAEVFQKSTRRILASNIEITNVTEGYEESLITQNLDVTIRGDKDVLDKILSENIRVVADLAELGNTTGTFTVAAKVYVDGFSDVDAVGEYKVTVTISR